MDPRRVPAHTSISYTRADGTTRNLTSTELEPGYHYIEPTDAEGAAALAGYPVARKVQGGEDTTTDPDQAPVEVRETSASDPQDDAGDGADDTDGGK